MNFDKIIIVHEWFYQNGGSEKVVANMVKIFKDKHLKLFVLFKRKHVHELDQQLEQMPVDTSFLDSIPYIQKIYRFLLPPSIFLLKYIKLPDTDIVLSSSHAVIKGIKKPRGAMHICYCHTPMRYIWDMYDDYAAMSSKIVRFFLGLLLNPLRNWDRNSANNVDYFIANSKFVQARIEKYYHRTSVVIYPPVDDVFFYLNEGARKDYYLCIGRLVPYKRIDMVIDAFRQLKDKKLIIVGDGYLSKKVEKEIATCPNINYIGYQPKAALRTLIQEAKACIFAAKEDFGIGCVESQFCGTPVIANRCGGYLETVTDGLSGYFFDGQNVQNLIACVEQFEEKPLQQHATISRSVETFKAQKFEERMTQFISKAYSEFHAK